MSGPYSTAKLLLDSNGSPVIMSGSDQDEDIALVSAKSNPLTGGVELVGTRVPIRITPPEFHPSILGSLVVGATYGQAGTLVTVTATAHGLPSTKNGYRIFWPGSAAIPAGWYSGFAYVDANSYTFQNATSQTVTAGTAMTGSAVNTYVSVGSITIPGDYLTNRASITTEFLRSGDATSAVKSLRAFAGAVGMGQSDLTTVPFGKMQISMDVSPNDQKIWGSGFVDGVQATVVRGPSAATIASDVVIDLRASVSVVSGWCGVESLVFEVAK